MNQLHSHIDPTFQFNKLLAEFLNEYKNRFQQINYYQGMPGKIGYSAKLKDGVHTLNLYLSDRFPLNAPLMIVTPKMDHEIVDQYGNVIDSCLKSWSYHSTLKQVVAIILGKLEGVQQQGMGFNSQINNFNLQNNMINPQVDNKKDLDEISNNLFNDLNSKKLEELIYIYYNEDDYIFDFTNKLRQQNTNLIQEIDQLSEQNSKLKIQYEDAKNSIEGFKKEFEEKEKQLSVLLEEKKNIDSRFTNEKLIEEIKKNMLKKTIRNQGKSLFLIS